MMSRIGFSVMVNLISVGLFMMMAACAGVSEAAPVGVMLGASIMRYNGTNIAVSLSFDDTSDCQLTFAVEELNKLNLRGTFYATISRIDKMTRSIDPIGLMAVPERLSQEYKWKRINEAIVKHGHELGCHMNEHLVLSSSASRSTITADMDKWEARVQEMVPGYDTKDVTVAYPKGISTSDTRRIIGERFLGGRVVTSTCSSKNFEKHHLPENSVKRLEIMGCEPHSDAIVDEYYNSLLQSKGWFVFIYHGLTSCAHGAYEDAMLTRQLTWKQKDWMKSIPSKELWSEKYFAGRNRLTKDSFDAAGDTVKYMGLQRKGDASDTMSCQWGWASYRSEGAVRDWSKLSRASQTGTVWVAPVRDVLKYEIQWKCLTVVSVEKIDSVDVKVVVRNTCSSRVGPGGWPVKPLPVAISVVGLDKPISFVSCEDASACSAWRWKGNQFFLQIKNNSFQGDVAVRVESGGSGGFHHKDPHFSQNSSKTTSHTGNKEVTNEVIHKKVDQFIRDRVMLHQQQLN
eukprot:m.109610 g.109610  ORF g.109610 m.109610 type:complete len:514 (-) comp9203_c0_seq2:208-1749(-)